MLEILGKIGFDYQLAIANLVNFIVVFWVLKKMIFQPIKDTIDERQKKISEGLAFSEKATEDFQKTELERKEIIENAKIEADSILKESSAKASKVEGRAVSKAKIETDKMKESALQEISRKEQEMNSKLQENISELALLVADKIIKEDFDTSTKKSFVDNMATPKTL